MSQLIEEMQKKYKPKKGRRFNHNDITYEISRPVLHDNSLEFGGYVNFWINPNVSIGGLLSLTAGNIEDNVTSADSDYIGYSAGLAIEGRI